MYFFHGAFHTPTAELSIRGDHLTPKGRGNEGLGKMGEGDGETQVSSYEVNRSQE